MKMINAYNIFCLKNVKTGDYVEYLDVDGRIILKLALK
jgi:hypothetical protein